MADLPCRYDRLVALLGFLAGWSADDYEPCTDAAMSKALVRWDDVIDVEVYVPLCPAHDREVSASPGYLRSIGRRDWLATST
jgi:hypothetical protein